MEVQRSATSGSSSSVLVGGLVALAIAVSIGVTAYVQKAVKKIESELPLRVMQEKRDMEQVARNFYEFVATTDAALARSSGDVSSVREGLNTVEQDLETLRERYSFDTLIGASALHAALSPVVEDVRIWVRDGFGSVSASSPLVLEVVATRARDALGKVYDKTAEADRIAYDILERQSEALRELRTRLSLVVVAFVVLAIGLVWAAVHQHRSARARQLAESARTQAQTQLRDALESTLEGFAFFDSCERLVTCNTRYREYFFADIADVVVQGQPFETIVRRATELGIIADAKDDPEAWLQRRLEEFRSPQGTSLHEFEDGRWVQVDEHRTTDGGIVAVYSDVSELKAREHDLVGAKEEAEAANRAKSEFLANVSHELRTPLTSILGFTRIIQRRLNQIIIPAVNREAPRVERALEQVSSNIDIVLNEGERLTALINNVLDLEKIEAGEIDWDIIPIDVSEALDRASGATASLFDGVSIEFATAVEPGLPLVLGDRDKVVQVIVNLLSNAVKFTEKGGITCFAKRSDDDMVTISVADTGCGIESDEQALVFEKFRQVGDTLTEKPSGTGLGLAICREIVEHLGGRIFVDSSPGSGSTFSFTLPIAPQR
jgi:signal transduction histidine kinase